MVAVDVVRVGAVLAAGNASLGRPDAGDAALVLVCPRVTLGHDGVGSDVDYVALILQAASLALHVGLASVVAALAQATRLGADLPPDVLRGRKVALRADGVERSAVLQTLFVIRCDHHAILNALAVVNARRIRVVLPGIDLLLDPAAGSVLARL